MSLSTLLLSSKAQLDTELDNLFTIQTAPSTVDSRRSKETIRQKRKHQSTGNGSLEDIPKKRLKSNLEDKSGSIPDEGTLPAKDTKTKKMRSRGNDVKKQKGKDVTLDVENARASASAPTSVSDDGCEDSERDEENGRPSTLLHESLANDTKKRTKQKMRKHVPEDETPDMRDRRTIFVGNLPLDVLSKKPVKKQLQRHILSFVASTKIESIRFRSIPFQVPTSKLQTSDDEEITPKKTEARTHSVDRASLWRTHHEDKDEASVKVDEKKYLTPSQKKKIAYINQEFHSTADTVNAYIVFAHPVDPEARPDNLPPLPATMDPYQAALQVSQKADGSLFMERMIRVDLAKRTKAGTSSLDDTSTVSVPLNREADSQLSIFVGNLEFGSKEEDLRVFFEGLMCTERGPPSEGQTPDGEDDGDGAATEKPLTWVTRVRIIRDKDTQLGKGFAYLQFADRECVDEVLAMEESKLKFAKRKLRVQRCKRIPEGLKHGVAQSTATHAKSKQTSSRSTGTIVVPKGDPGLGIKLAGLSKEERKKLKSMDSDRKTRRLAKKKARMSMASNVAKDRKRVRSKG